MSLSKLSIEVLTPGLPIVEKDGNITLQGSRIRVRGLSTTSGSNEAIITLHPSVSPERYAEMAASIIGITQGRTVEYEILHPEGDGWMEGVRSEQPADASLGFLLRKRFLRRPRPLLFWKRT